MLGQAGRWLNTAWHYTPPVDAVPDRLWSTTRCCFTASKCKRDVSALKNHIVGLRQPSSKGINASAGSRFTRARQSTPGKRANKHRSARPGAP